MRDDTNLHLKNSNIQAEPMGDINPLVVVVVVLTLLVLGLAGFGLWSYMHYRDEKVNVDAKISTAVATAKKQQTDADNVSFAEQEKVPTRQFTGPDDLGRVQFSYPKTWSVYTDRSSDSGLESYMYPLVVPSLSSGTPYALRISIVNTAYEDSLRTYHDAVQSGLIRASQVTVNGNTGTRLDGLIEQNIHGSMVLFKVRDKTVQLFTESIVFRHDFDTLLGTLTFNK